MPKVDSDIVFYAFRYALGRMTYAVKDVSDYLVAHWDELDLKTQQVIQRDIRQAIDRGEAGMTMDVLAWTRILDLPAKDGYEKRLKMPIVNLDEPEKNCKVCGHEHGYGCKCGCPAVPVKL